MRTIEKKRFTVDLAKGTAELVLRLVEKGKVLPFQVLVTHKGPTRGKAAGVLAALPSEEEAGEQYEFHIQQAVRKGWYEALPGGMKRWAGVAEPDGEIPGAADAPPPPPARRKPGRPRKVRG